MKTRNLIILGLAVLLSACASPLPVKPVSPCAYYSDGKNATFRCINYPTTEDIKNRCDWYNGHCWTAEDMRKAERAVDELRNSNEEYARTHPGTHPTIEEMREKEAAALKAANDEWNRTEWPKIKRRMDEEDARLREVIDRQYLIDTLRGIEEELIDLNRK